MLKRIFVALMVIVIAIGVTGCFKKSTEYPASSIAMSEEEAAKISDKVPIHLYFAEKDNKLLKLEVHYIPLEEAKKTTAELATLIMEQLIKGPDAAKPVVLNPTIPAGTTLLSPIEVANGVATVNLSQEFVTNHPGGKDLEQITIFSVVNTLTELKEIDKVKFMIDGKTFKEYKGNFKFDAEFPRSMAIISMQVDSVYAISNNLSTTKAKATAAPAAAATTAKPAAAATQTPAVVPNDTAANGDTDAAAAEDQDAEGVYQENLINLDEEILE